MIPMKLKALMENIPLARLGKTSDVAGVAAFLASADADYITGATIVVDGGLDLELQRTIRNQCRLASLVWAGWARTWRVV